MEKCPWTTFRYGSKKKGYKSVIASTGTNGCKNARCAERFFVRIFESEMLMFIELKAKKDDEDYSEEGETGGDSKKRKQRAKCEETTKKIQEYLASGNIERLRQRDQKQRKLQISKKGTEIQEDSGFG